MTTRSVPAGEENDAAAKLVDVATSPPAPSPEAVEADGAKQIRCRHNDTFVVRKDLVVDGAWREYPAKQAAEIIEAAARNGVKLSVALPEKKG